MSDSWRPSQDEDHGLETEAARPRRRGSRPKAPWTWREPGAEGIREDSEREGKDRIGGCIVYPLHHPDDSTARASASKGRGGGTKPMKYEVDGAETL